MQCALCTDPLDFHRCRDCEKCHTSYCITCNQSGVCLPCTVVLASERVGWAGLTDISLPYLQMYVRNNYSQMEEASKTNDKNELARIIMRRNTAKSQQGASRYPATTENRENPRQGANHHASSAMFRFESSPLHMSSASVASNSRFRQDPPFYTSWSNVPITTIDLTDADEERTSTAANHISNFVAQEEARLQTDLHYMDQDQTAQQGVLASRFNPDSIFRIRHPAVRSMLAARIGPMAQSSADPYAQSRDEVRVSRQQEQETSYRAQTSLQQTQYVPVRQQWEQQQQQTEPQQQQWSVQPAPVQPTQVQPAQIQRSFQRQQQQTNFVIQPIDMRITGGHQQQQPLGLFPQWETDPASVAHSHYSTFRGLMSPGGGSIAGPVRVGRTSGLTASRVLPQTNIQQRHQRIVSQANLAARFHPYSAMPSSFQPSESPQLTHHVAAAAHIGVMTFPMSVHHSALASQPPIATVTRSPSPPCPSLAELLTDDKVRALSKESLRRVLKKNYVDPGASSDHEVMVKKVIELRGLVKMNGIKSQLADVGDGDDKDLCKICFEKPIDCVFLECGHMCSCFDCTDPLNDCPICREPIKRAVRTFKC